MSKAPLSDRTKTELADLARRRGVPGWETMKKDELVKTLSAPIKGASKPSVKPTPKIPVKQPVKATPVAAKATVKPRSTKPSPAKPIPTKPIAAKAGTNGTTKHTFGNGKPTPTPIPLAKVGSSSKNGPSKPEPIATKSGSASKLDPVKVPHTSNIRVEAAIPTDKDLSVKSKSGTPIKDRIVLTAPDAYWLHAMWELSLQSIQRAEAALGQDWHGAKPIIRIFDVTSADTTSTSEAPVRDIVVHGGCSHWYIDVPQPPRSYRADIGYLARSGRFFRISSSNVLTPPKAGASEVLEDGLPSGEGRTDRGSSLPEDDGGLPGRDLHDDAFRRPLKENAFGTGAVLPGKLKKFFFDIDAELIVYGKTDPTATVTLQNEPVKLRTDGTFTMRFSLPDSRQIIPAVAVSADGLEEQTIVLAVERNIKRLDPTTHDQYAEG